MKISDIHEEEVFNDLQGRRIIYITIKNKYSYYRLLYKGRKRDSYSYSNLLEIAENKKDWLIN